VHEGQVKKTIIATMAVAGALVVLGCGPADAPPSAREAAPQPPPAPQRVEAVTGTTAAVANVQALGGSGVTGTAAFRQDGGTITLQLDLRGLPPGAHAAHIHEHGDCSAPDGSSAGAHWNPTQQDHGRWGHGSHHLGDLGNVEAAADGTASLLVTSDAWQIATGAPVDVVGKAIIVHTSADDFTTQPTGNAGGRIACGVIERR
jgi:Cu-Zn family superoxide dismutase